MTTPVDTDTLVQGAVKWLSSFDDVIETLGAYPDTATPYLFQNSLWQTIEGTQSAAAVISRAGGWAGPNQHNTMRFPRISLEIFVDPLRDIDGNVTEPGETGRRAEAAYRVLDAHLHRPQSGVQMWGTIRTLGCTRLGEPAVYSMSDGDGMVLLQVFYGVVEG